jgi:N-acetyl-beta-hexosaminidase
MHPIGTIIISSLVVILLICVGELTCLQTVPTVWPQPNAYDTTESSQTFATVSSSLFNSITSVKSTSSSISINRFPVLYSAIQRYSEIVFATNSIIDISQAKSRWINFVSHVNETTIRIEYKKIELQLLITDTTTLPIDTDESYSIALPDSGQTITIEANNQWGALRALETLSQLIVPTVVSDNTLYTYSIPALPIFIRDKPRFKWRGFLLDLARHYIPVNTIKKIIDALAYDKFNKLHLHMIDAQSFPIVVPEYENLSKLGAFSPELVYTQKDMVDIIDYGYERGVEVYPEFDTPGHAYSWSFAYPDAVSTCPPNRASNMNNFPVQPASQRTYDIIDALAKYSQSIFDRTPYFHIGSDEVVASCWQNDATVQAFMNSQEAKDKGITTMMDLYGYFQTRVEAIVTKYKRTMICWDELVLNVHTHQYTFPADKGIVQVWRDNQLMV